ncbi:HNH endonuclease [Nocardioides KLBMP 9356]|uniref:HNH endonuclease n=1 Tax=Nocardioides potassii TaxID=2911371 RepID=A0ABS9HAY3_9ACTN|nr:HNH endonuclease signature motif containing protein [Nocardioides potassii]MCF6378362.1 HNH endonuclease [Nocardioides potassii]
MSAIPLSEEHRVTALARDLCVSLGVVAGLPVWSMSAAEAGDALVLLTRARSQLDALLVRVLGQATAVGTGSEVGLSTHAWWARETRVTQAEVQRLSSLASALERYDGVAAALASGDLRLDQARVVVDAVDALPVDVSEVVAADATRFLLDKAVEHDAKALRVLGRRVLEVVDPVAADAEEARRLEAEEADARARASFTMVDDGHGQSHGRFSIPTLHGEVLRKHLLAIAFPSRFRRDPGGDAVGAAPVERGVTRHRMGLAFVDYIESRPEASVPSAGGVPATVVVTMDVDTLTGGLKAASLDTGGRISAGEARRIACRAGIVPVVLGGPSVVLDVGRRRRFHSEAQRVAMGVRDGGCTAAGCDAPPAFCHAHHDDAWARGGRTSVAAGRLLCPKHHRLVHDPAFQHGLDKHGQVLFTRRT